MTGHRVLPRLLARALMLLAALLAVCAFHSVAVDQAAADASAPAVAVTTDAPAPAVAVDQGAAVAPASGMAATSMVDLVGPLHVDVREVPATDLSSDGHAHLTVVGLLALALSLLLLSLVSRASRVVAVRRIRDPLTPPARFGLPDPWPATPVLVRLCVARI